MFKNDSNPTLHRRGFLGSVAGGAAALGLASLAPSLSLTAAAGVAGQTTADNPDDWFNKINGKHRVVFDVTQPHDILPFAWPKVFLMTNEQTGTAEKDCSVVVVLRHDAIPYGMEDSLWAKYKFGEFFRIDDAKTKKPSERNAFWKPKPGDFSVPGVGNVAIGINELQESGVMFCICEMAMTVMSAALSGKMNLDAAEVKKEWKAGLLPGIQVVPSGVWALGRAQEKGCSYIFAG